MATDVAARGLDIAGVENVIHYQVPRTAEVREKRISPSLFSYFGRSFCELFKDKSLVSI